MFIFSNKKKINKKKDRVPPYITGQVILPKKPIVFPVSLCTKSAYFHIRKNLLIRLRIFTFYTNINSWMCMFYSKLLFFQTYTTRLKANKSDKKLIATGHIVNFVKSMLGKTNFSRF